MESPLEDVDNTLEMRGPEPETAPIQLAKETSFAFLFTSPIAPPKPHERAKRHCFRRTNNGEDSRARMKERTDLEDATRTSWIDEETCHMRARKLTVGASSLRHETVERSTTECAEIDVGTIEGIPTKEVVCSGKPDPTAY